MPRRIAIASLLLLTLLPMLDPRSSVAAAAPIARIGVRQVGGVGEFYDKGTGASFVPRGANYTRLRNVTDHFGGTCFYHVTFNVGEYDSLRCEAALEKMGQDCYNVVRVLLNSLGNSGGLTDPSSAGVSTPYLANLVDDPRSGPSTPTRWSPRGFSSRRDPILRVLATRG